MLNDGRGRRARTGKPETADSVRCLPHSLPISKQFPELVDKGYSLGKEQPLGPRLTTHRSNARDSKLLRGDRGSPELENRSGKSRAQSQRSLCNTTSDASYKNMKSSPTTSQERVLISNERRC